MLKEVKYLGMLKTQNIPKAALCLFSKREQLCLVSLNCHLSDIEENYKPGTVTCLLIALHRVLQQTQTLILVTQWYNQLQSTILDVELGLVKDEMESTRRQLDPALRELTWAQDDVWDYIKSTRDLVQVAIAFTFTAFSHSRLLCDQGGAGDFPS